MPAQTNGSREQRSSPLPRTSHHATRVLVSVRSVAEATQAAAARVAFIDLKEPSAGALGGLPLADITAIVRHLRADTQARHSLISATIGDQAPETVLAVLPDIARRVRAVAACGVDHVKVGVSVGPGAHALVACLRGLAQEGYPVVPVLIADAGIDPALLDALCARPGTSEYRYAGVGSFQAIMVDTQDKRGGSLLARVPADSLVAMIRQVRTAGAMAGLAGALQLGDVPALRALQPDFAGFRSAVCAGARTSQLDPSKLTHLLAAMAMAPRAATTAAAPA